MKNLLFITFLISLVIPSCKKDSNSIDPNAPIFLRDKTITEVKSEIVGNWKIHYSYGYGLTGSFKTATPNSYFKVLRNDSVYLTFNNILYAADVASYQRINTAFGYSAVSINFFTTSSLSTQWIYDYKVKDSLWLINNCVSCAGYIMTKVP